MYPWNAGDALSSARLKANGGDYQTAGGSSNAFTLTASAVSSYTSGDWYLFKANHAITGAVTLNVSAIGVKSIKKKNGRELQGGDIIVDQMVLVAYDGADFQIISEFDRVDRLPIFVETIKVIDGGVAGYAGDGVFFSGYNDDPAANFPISFIDNNNTSNNTSYSAFAWTEIGQSPYVVDRGGYSSRYDGGIVYIGTDRWISDATSIYKNGSVVTISGTGIAGDSALGYDPTNGYLLVLDSSTTVHRYSGVGGTTITYVDEITLDNAVDTDRGFIFDDVNTEYIFIDGNDLRRFGSTGTTLDTVTPANFPVDPAGLAIIHDRIYITAGWGIWTNASPDINIHHVRMVPTTMTRN